MKSITPIVSVILLIMLTIVASIGAYFFITTSVNDLQSSGAIDDSPYTDNSRLNLVSITGSQALVRNDGTSPVTEMIILINGETLNYTLDTPIQPGEIREINYTSQLIGQDLEIKLIYNKGKTEKEVSPASVNTANSGFVETIEEESLLEFLRVNSASIIQKSYGLEGYCNATSDNSNDLIMYNYTWKINGISNLSNSKFAQSFENMGLYHSCMILENGSAMCWGNGINGQLGNEQYSSIDEGISYAYSPIFVTGDYSFKSISAGGYHTCGVLTNESGLCWGSNSLGELGNGGVTASKIPVFVSGNYNFSSIQASSDYVAGGGHTCGLLTNGSAVCWGYGGNGQLGGGSTPETETVPSFVSGGYTFSKISLRSSYSCGILINGSALCWGNNEYGTLGNGQTSSSSEPVFVSGNYIFKSLSTSMQHVCGVLANGSAVCWGYNADGRLGNGSNTGYSSVPIFVSGNYEFIIINSGDTFSCGILNNGSAVCWGNGEEWGALGGDNSNTPVFVFDNNYNFSTINPGRGFTCGILTNSSAICWGYGSSGQLGNGQEYSEPSGTYSPVFVSGNYNFINNSYYWNKDTFISMLPSSYYSSEDAVTFECIAMNATASSLPKTASI